MTHLSQHSAATNDGEHNSNTNPRRWIPQAELCSPFSNLAIEAPLTRTAPSCNPSSGSHVVPSQSIGQDQPKQPPFKKHQTEKQGIYRDLPKGKKRTTRRVNILREMDKDQDSEPTRIDPFNALPQFGYLDIAKQLATDIPSELGRFGQMDLIKGEAADDTFYKESLKPVQSVDASSDAQSEIGWDSELNEFRHMDSPTTSAPDTSLDMPMSSLLTSDDGGEFCPEDVRDAAAAFLARIRETRLDVMGSAEDEGTTIEQRLSNLSIQAASSRHPAVESQSSANREQYTLDNSFCASFLCPIQEPHNGGPYHHNNILGDKDHPQ